MLPSITSVDLDLPGRGALPGLGATFMAPDQPRAGALILQGAGVHDRDGAMPAFGFKSSLYRRLAIELAERFGIATLRYDKRGSQAPADALFDYTVAQRVADAQAAFMVLLARSEVADKPLFVIGHSEGGLIGMRLSTELWGLQGPRPAACAALASPFGNVFELSKSRARRLIDHNDETKRAMAQRWLEFYERLETLFEADRNLTPAEFRDLSRPYLDSAVDGWESFAWLRDHWQGVIASDPTLQGCPTLVLQGGRDARLAADNPERWQHWCQSRPQATFVRIDHMGHDLNDATRKAFVLDESMLAALGAYAGRFIAGA